MKHLIFKWFGVFLFLMFARQSIGQNVLLDIKNMCANSTLCNPFINGYACGAGILVRTTHGSPSFYLPTTNPTREIELRAKISTNGSNYSEGVTFGYPFVAGKKYTVKIKHMGMPTTGAVIYPYLMAGFTNSPPRNNDGCDLGYLAAYDVVTSANFIISQNVATSSFDFTPASDVFNLWLSSIPVQFPEAGILIFSIEIVDHSVTTNPPTDPPPTYGCYWDPYDFCHGNSNWPGSVQIRAVMPLTMNCDVFYGNHSWPAGSDFQRYFASPKIILNPGFHAIASNPYSEIRSFKATATDDPCHHRFRRAGQITNIQQVEEISDKPISDNIQIYPSPSRGLVKVIGDKQELQDAAFTVLDQSGRVVYRVSNNSTSSPKELNLQHLANGIYFITIKTPLKTSIKKVIIQK